MGRQGSSARWVALALAAGPVAVVLGEIAGCLLRGTPVALGQTLAEAVIATTLLGGLWGLLPVHARWDALAVGLVGLAMAASTLGHVVEFGGVVTPAAFDGVVGTNAREVREYVAGREPSIAASALCAGVALALLVIAVRRLPSAELGWRARAGLVVLAAVAIGGGGSVRDASLPVALGASWVSHLRVRAAHAQAVAARLSPRAPRTAESALVVVVVGESLRADRLGIYGYPHPTSPRLAAVDSLVVFRDALTTANTTQPAIETMFSAGDARTYRTGSAPSILALAQEAGWETVWLSNQEIAPGSGADRIARGARLRVVLPNLPDGSRPYDEALLPVLDRVIARGAPRTLVVLHLMGCHESYNRRVPSGVFPFPEPRADAGRRERTSADYDRAVAYSDRVVGRVLDRLADRPDAALVFVADHGESLYDPPERWLGHGTPHLTPAQLRVPLVVWLGTAWRARQPGDWRALWANRERPVSTANLYDGLVLLLDLPIPERDDRRSPFSERFEAPPRFVLTSTYRPARVVDG